MLMYRLFALRLSFFHLEEVAFARDGLGEVERAICALEDGLCAVGFTGTSDADAQREGDLFAADVVRLFDLGFDALADAARDGGCGVGQHDEEFIAAPAADDVSCAQQAAQDVGDGPERDVTCRVAVAVVDVLEVV